MNRGTNHTLTVDVEEWFHGMELLGFSAPSRLRIGLDPLLDLLERHAATATFFVLGPVAQTWPGLVAELEAAGHEVASHGWTHEFVYRRTRAAFREDVARATGVVASELGHRVAGFRAPYFSITRDSLWALDVLAELGLRYDSSVFPVFNDRYGMPGAPRRPYRVETPSGPIVEVPVTPARLLGVNVPFSGGAYLRILPAAVQAALWRVASREGPVVAYVHPWELDVHHPVPQVRRRVRATHYFRLARTAPTLERLLSRYSFGRVDALIDNLDPPVP
jgi:polysaccharide deacetylase family protein (PEP-CTERM system associated)